MAKKKTTTAKTGQADFGKAVAAMEKDWTKVRKEKDQVGGDFADKPIAQGVYTARLESAKADIDKNKEPYFLLRYVILDEQDAEGNAIAGNNYSRMLRFDPVNKFDADRTSPLAQFRKELRALGVPVEKLALKQLTSIAEQLTEKKYNVELYCSTFTTRKGEFRVQPYVNKVLG